MRVPDISWWGTSLACNAVCLGSPQEPLCSRIYRQPDSRARDAYLRAADAVFHESGHCRRVWLTWAVLRLLRD